MNDVRIRPKKTNYETDSPHSIDFFQLPEIIDEENYDELTADKIYVYKATLLSNVKFTVQDVETKPQAVTFDTTTREIDLAGGQKIANSKAIVIGERIGKQWYIARELKVGGEVLDG
ncbi:hypothetical protein Enr17x_29100 [Gimesia fumaroli]|uniref:Uncharacterized protein n=2 Tax=Gimesia fumaroli TaxID=2527976 RepID=A0A518ICN0_9PLAN|nr:hypothetical protein Enr17x_29100 [Gimesia fumaroli]